MKAYLYLLFALVVFTVIMVFFGLAWSQTDPVKCNTIDSLYSVVKSGKPASYDKTAWIDEYSLIEKSTIYVYPSVNQAASYKVQVNINEINEGEYSASLEEYSILECIVSGCSDFGSKYKSFVKTSCWFTTENPEDIYEVVVNGFSFKIYNNYVIEGSLIKLYKKLCEKEHKPVPVKRPAVYLYPVNPMNVSVKVEVNGKLTYTDPYYGSGWNVFAESDGLINGKYDYLFYEADLNKVELPDEGWIVEYDNLEKWFKEYLPALGLNKKETEQFTEYWLNKLKKANYYEIKILSNSFLAGNMRLLINPEPETLLRLNFHFRPLSVKHEIIEPVISKVDRKGFTVVEWGGIDAGELMSAN